MESVEEPYYLDAVEDPYDPRDWVTPNVSNE